MTTRKPRRKAPRKTARGASKGRSIGWIWWTAGLLSLGWIVFDANRAAILPHVSDLAALVNEPERRVPPPAAPAPQSVATRTPAEPARTPAAKPVPAKTVPAKAVPTPPARVAARAPASATPAAAEIRPTRRPSAPAAASSGRAVTGRATPLRREPSETAPAWVTLEAGHPLRITGRKGDWRQVEAGIFTGWIDAGAVGTPAPPRAMPTRSAQANTGDDHPVPRGAIPGAGR